MSRYVIDLADRGALQTALSGGKGAGLAWLVRQRANVPAGFVITTEAFREFLAAGRPDPAPGPEDDGNEPAAGAAALQRTVETAPFPSQLSQAILRAYRRLGGHQAAPVAVRSSLVGEDESVASFAGQFSTLLQVEGEEALLAAVRACWASSFSCRALSYRVGAEKGAESRSNGPAMAVVVQRMVAATAAGVAFSADPVSGEICTIIEAAHGLGDAVVSGRANADRYVIDARGVLAEILPAVPGAPVLQEDEIMRLAEIVRDLARRAGGPRDIEWARDSDFCILQCRPITSLAGRRVYSSRLTADMAPGLLKPLVYSTNTYAVAREVFGKLFTELIGPNDYDYRRLVPRICSRAYADMTLMGELLTRVGLPPNFMEMMLRSERADRSRAMRMDLHTSIAMSRMARLAFRHGRLPRHQAVMLAQQRAALDPYCSRDWSQTPLNSLLPALDQLVANRNSSFWLFFVSVMGLAVRNAILRRWVEQRASDVPFNDLIRGLTGLRSLEPLHEIGRLAGLARQLPPDLRAELTALSHDELRARLGGSTEGEALFAAVEAFLGRFGFLSSNGSDFTASTWAENPALIWRTVARAAESPDAASPEDAAAARLAARRRIRARLGPLPRAIFDRLLASVVAAIDLREAVSLLMSEYSYQIRRLFLAIADALVEAGELSEREDLFYLIYDEVRALAGGCLQAAELRARIAERRAEIELDAQFTPPEVISGEVDLALRQTWTVPEAAACLTGIAGSSGTAEGRARVIWDPAAAPAVLSREDILVVPYSDVGWTPLFSSIGGIVAETGGQLSHAAIVAREYGLPAVVGVKNATRLIREGQPLSVDGNQGRVYLATRPGKGGGATWTQ